MKSLVFWGAAHAGDAAERARGGARILAWTTAAEAALSAAKVPHVTLREFVLPEDRDWIDEAAILWTKEWGRRRMREGLGFRDLLHWKGVSLWWFAELYLHHSTRAPGYVRTIETLLRVLETDQPPEVEAVGLADTDVILLARTCTARAILFHGRVPAASGSVLGVSLRSRWNTAKTVAAWMKNAVRRAPTFPPATKPRVLFLSHAAFWRERPSRHAEMNSPAPPPDEATDEPEVFEHYFDRVIPELAARGDAEPMVVAVGPRAAFRRRGTGDRLREWAAVTPERGPYVHVDRFVTRRVVSEVWRATGVIRAAWEEFRRMPATTFTHRNVAFGDLAAPDLASTLLLQLPWAVRSYEETAEVLAAARPAALCLYAESSGWGRAAVAAARAAGVRTVAVQHGILYPKYFSYRHEPDEAACPRPDVTAVFGEDARTFLVEDGAYAPESLVVTGSPKFDALLAAARQQDVGAVRTRLGVKPDEKLVVVASRFRPIRDTHEAIGAELPALLRAIEALPGVRCILKPHPAEPARPYEACLREARAKRTTLAPAGTDLVSLLPAADALVTVESLSAVEALVLGLPLLILSMPSNLKALVDQDVALGVPAGADPKDALSAVLFDETTRAQLDLARAVWLAGAAHGVDGQATRRIVDLLSDAAGVAPAPASGVVG